MAALECVDTCVDSDADHASTRKNDFDFALGAPVGISGKNNLLENGRLDLLLRRGPELSAPHSALDACDKKKQDATDAYGRRLRLHRLPPDLLALTDPRNIVVTGTRLPEDIENWAQWVTKERP